MNADDLLSYLQRNQAKLNFQGLAEAAGVNVRTLRTYVAGTRGAVRGIPPGTVAGLVQALESLRK